MKTATVKITDIKDKDGLYLIGVKIKAGRYSFIKAIGIRPHEGDISVDAFKRELKGVIIKEVNHRKAIEPIKRLKEDEFIIEYENSKS
jgi:hypothetical protein